MDPLENKMIHPEFYREKQRRMYIYLFVNPKVLD